jgi:transposase-like protein
MTLKKFNRRELRGLGIVAQGGQIQRLDDGLFQVKSQCKDGVSYKVRWINDKWECECPDYLKRNKPCKHIFAVNFVLNLPSMILANSEMFGRECPHCGSKESTLKGFRHNKTGAVKLRKCKQCGRRFKDGFMAESKGTNTTIKLVAFDLNIKGVSLRDIRNHIWQIYCVRKSVSTLHRWIVKMIRLMQEALGNLKSKIGSKWLGDEMLVKVNGQVRYLWNIMDYESRVHIVSTLTQGRGAKEALLIIKKAIQEAGKSPRKFITDGLHSYSKALSELGDSSIKHVSNVGLTGKKDNNNRIERLHGTIKSWARTQRGMKSRSQEHIDIRRQYYNQIRPHMALKDKTPAKSKDARWLHFITAKRAQANECL